MKTINDNLRDEIIAKVLDAPETLSQEELLLIRNDEELRELYDLAVLCRDAGATESVEVPDVEAELVAFKQSRRKVVPLVRYQVWKRVAAIFVGGAVMTFAVVAALHPDWVGFAPEKTDEMAHIEQQASTEPSGAVATPDVALEIVNDSDLIYDNVSLEAILTEIAEIYKVEVKLESENAKTLRLYVKIEQGKTLSEVVQILGTFEQFDIKSEGNVVIVK